MQFGNLLVRSGPHRILVPGENVAGIEPAADLGLAAMPWQEARRRGWSLVFDTRRLLGAASGGLAGVVVHWHARDGGRQAVLCVDAVEGLSEDNDRTLLQPRLPRALRPLFSGVVHDGDGGFRLQLRRDAALPLDQPGQRRHLARAILGALPPPAHRGHPPP